MDGVKIHRCESVFCVLNPSCLSAEHENPCSSGLLEVDERDPLHQ